ncbi:MAG: nucleotidyl transferase AbiEii/AbiGii toxin family protein [Deltaproteobacteria bacterium]|nr:nucleotidyl transferase AbiEii/AbiGii toxin family protein [Deltaproteobacteria bacterium]
MSKAPNRQRFQQQVQLLLEVLPFVTSDPRFALKGGTAINLFIRDMPRLSVDIDLTYLSIEPRTESYTTINAILKNAAEEITRRFKTIRVTPSKPFNSGSELKLIVASSEATIIVEPNYILRGSVFPPVARSLSESCRRDFGVAVTTQTLSFEDIYGGKICAALDRQHPRDLFDVKVLLENEGISRELMTAFLVYLISHNRPISEVLSPNLKDLSAIYAAEFSGITVKSVSLDELVATRAQLITTLHKHLTDPDRAFLLAFKAGRPDWSSFDHPHVQNFPGILWKVKNLEKLSFIKLRESIAKLEKVLAK